MYEGQRGIDSARETVLRDRVDANSSWSVATTEQHMRREESLHRDRLAPDRLDGPCEIPKESESKDQIPHRDIIDRLAAEDGEGASSLPFALRVLVAAAVIGEREYLVLRDRAALWKHAIRQWHFVVASELARKLADAGVSRWPTSGQAAGI
jgi:hypothetical protein